MRKPIAAFILATAAGLTTAFLPVALPSGANIASAAAKVCLTARYKW